MKKILSTLAVSTALLTAPAHAQLFEGWDTDESGTLGLAEFTPGIHEQGLFSDWNTNEDEALSEDEFESGLFGLFDDDDNGELTQAEWDEGVDAWFGEQAVDADFSAWDDDGDGVLSEAEFTGEIGTLDTGFDEFAGDDQQVTETEFDEGMFGWFEEDEDDDEELAEDEWDPLFGLLD